MGLNRGFWKKRGLAENRCTSNRKKQACRSHGKTHVSINDHPQMQIRETFAGLVFHDLEITYTVGLADSRREASRELVITNWEPDALGQLF